MNRIFTIIVFIYIFGGRVRRATETLLGVPPEVTLKGRWSGGEISTRGPVILNMQGSGTMRELRVNPKAAVSIQSGTTMVMTDV